MLVSVKVTVRGAVPVVTPDGVNDATGAGGLLRISTGMGYKLAMGIEAFHIAISSINPEK